MASPGAVVLIRILALVALMILSACSPRVVHQEEPISQAVVPALPREEIFQKPKAAPLIVLDPGHGGHDDGAHCVSPQYPEKRAALQLALLLQRQLTGLGYRVALTRAQDVFLALHERAHAANQRGAAAFVSLHFNHCSNSQARGIEVFFYNHEPVQSRDVMSQKLAQDVLKGVIEITQARDRGVKEASFVVIRNTSMPSVLVEGGFLSNAEEGRAIGDARYLEKLAHGIALGVHRYFLNPPGQPAVVAKKVAASRSRPAAPTAAVATKGAIAPRPPASLKVRATKLSTPQAAKGSPVAKGRSV